MKQKKKAAHIAAFNDQTYVKNNGLFKGILKAFHAFG